MEKEPSYDTHMLPCDPDFDEYAYWLSVLDVLKNPAFNHGIILDVDPLNMESVIEEVEQHMDDIMRSRDVLNSSGLGGLR
jgi:hypothetical protein